MNKNDRKLGVIFYVVLAVCVAGVLSLLIFIPQVRELIISMGEKYVGRPLTHEVWHGRFIRWEKIFLIVDIVLIVCLQFGDSMTAKATRFFERQRANGIAISRLKTWLGISAIVFMVAHGYCFFNALYNHDSLLIFQNDIGWQVSLGRFLQPFYLMLFRGMIVAPWLIGCISFVFLMASAYLLLNLLNIRSLKGMCAATAMLISAMTLTLSNATYMPWSDVYMLALLLSVSGAYIAIKHGRYPAVSVVCMALSMGLYQSYIQVAVLLLMFDVFADVLRNKGVKDILKKCAGYLCVIAAAFVVFWCLAKMFQYACHVSMSDGYNGMANVGHYGGVRHLLSCFAGTYKYVLRSLVNPITAHRAYAFAARAVLVLAGAWAVGRILAHGRLSKANVLFAVMLLCLFPFGLNFVYFITQGMEHDLMTFSFAVVPLLLFPLMRSADEMGGEQSLRTARFVVYGSFAVIAFCNIIFANQTYLKKDLEAKSTLSVVTRIIDRIERTEGYAAGETEVCIIGSLEGNPLVIAGRAGFNYGGTGNWASVAATYNIEHYISYYLAYPYKRYWGECPPDLADSLGVFPAKNCTAIRDGVLYIKIGD